MDSGAAGHNHSKQHAANRIQPQMPIPGRARGNLGYSPYGYLPGFLVILGFNGDRPDPVNGCYLLGNGHRAFSPSLMRFISPDSMSPFGAGGLNTYAYCLGDPINRQDPDGHSSFMVAVRRLLNRLVPDRGQTVRAIKSSVNSSTNRPVTPAQTISENRANANTGRRGEVLIGWRGVRKDNVNSVVQRLREHHATIGLNGRGLYISQYKSVAKKYAGRNGVVVSVYAENFDKWVYDVHYSHAGQDEMLILLPAFKMVKVRVGEQLPLVLSDKFKEYMVSPPNSVWRKWDLPEI